MPRYLLLTLCLVLALPLLGQDDDDDDRDVTVNVRTSALGNAHVHLYGASRLLEAVPGTLNCSWANANRSGTCRGLLTSSSTLHLAPLVTALQLAGAKRVDVYLTVGSDSQEAAAPPGWKRDGTGRRSSYLSFTSTSRSNLPPDITIQVDRPPNLLIPILLVFAVPAVLAYAVRRRAAEASADRKMNWIVWLNWSSLGIWLYWISVVNPVQLPDYLLLLAPVGSISRLLLGVLIYAGPPLFSVSGCFLAMAPLLSSSKESFWLLLRQQFVAQATFQVPLGIFLVGVDNDDWSGPTFSLFAAYVVYRGLVWLNWTMSYSEVTPLESGDLFERASALARKAGVKLSKLGMLRTRVPEQANAFAMSGDKIVLTESLVRGLTPREVNAVIAHELGHHKAGHLRFNPSQILFWVFIFGVGPGMGWLVSRYHFPTWWLNIPILPLGLVVVQGFFSQRRELEADARAAQITDDPEGRSPLWAAWRN